MALDILPVIDVRNGVVVRAVKGRRDLYRPIETPLSAGADPVAVASGLLRLHPFDKLYIADLDAIEGNGHNTGAVMTLRQRFPKLDIWTDNGTAGAEAVYAWFGADRGTLVLGSESQIDGETVRRFRHEPRLVLSLDFRADAFQGPPELLDPARWPARVIAMTLARVGGTDGPDFERLEVLRSVHPACRIYAAGGVRGKADLERLVQLGVNGVLVASALHDGRLDASEIAAFARSPQHPEGD